MSDDKDYFEFIKFLKNKMNKKLEMLKGFCIYNMENKGNETYKQIDLVYDNQLIAIKK